MASNGRFSQIQAPIKMVHSNLDQEIIQITEDKLRHVLNEHVHFVERKREWITPLSIVIAVLTVFATSTFKDAYYLKAATWEAIFIVVGAISFLWLLSTGHSAITSPSVNDLVQRIKNKSEK